MLSLHNSTIHTFHIIVIRLVNIIYYANTSKTQFTIAATEVSYFGPVVLCGPST